MIAERTPIAILARFYEPAFRGGGPIQTLWAMIRASPEPISATVTCSNEDLGDSAPLIDTPDRWVHRADAIVWYTSPGWTSLARALNVIRRDIKPRIIYINSFFDLGYSVIPQLLNRLGFWRHIGIVLAPRGELNPATLAIKKLKKRIYINVYRLLRLQSHVLWHASTTQEANDIRRIFGSETAIIIRENETSLPTKARTRTTRLSETCRLVFASRAVPNKGLLIILEALQTLKEPINFEIIGAFENEDYKSQCEEAISRLPNNVSVDIRGAVPHEELLERLHHSDLMVIPTAGENFGHVIAESLSQSCPVLCSTNTPWTEILLSGAGGIVQSLSPDAWHTAIKDFVTAGARRWTTLSADAALGFNDWRSRDKGPHVFSTATQHLSGRPRNWWR